MPASTMICRHSPQAVSRGEIVETAPTVLLQCTEPPRRASVAHGNDRAFRGRVFAAFPITALLLGRGESHEGVSFAHSSVLRATSNAAVASKVFASTLRITATIATLLAGGLEAFEHQICVEACRRDCGYEQEIAWPSAPAADVPGTVVVSHRRHPDQGCRRYRVRASSTEGRRLGYFGSKATTGLSQVLIAPTPTHSQRGRARSPDRQAATEYLGWLPLHARRLRLRQPAIRNSPESKA